MSKGAWRFDRLTANGVVTANGVGQYPGTTHRLGCAVVPAQDKRGPVYSAERPVYGDATRLEYLLSGL